MTVIRSVVSVESTMKSWRSGGGTLCSFRKAEVSKAEAAAKQSLHLACNVSQMTAFSALSCTFLRTHCVVHYIYFSDRKTTKGTGGEHWSKPLGWSRVLTVAGAIDTRILKVI